MTNFNAAYKSLNEKQRQAVDTIEGPVMVLAGPGTGKTQTLATRIANIISKTDADPSSILALTFTDAGTKAMRRRLQSLIGKAAYYVPITTFHGFCANVIRENPDLFPISLSNPPISELKKTRVLVDIIKSLPLKILKPLGSPWFYVNALKKSISDLKREGYTPNNFENLLQELSQNFEVEKDELSKGTILQKEKDLTKNFELLEIYKEYCQRLQLAGDYDYDDMISYVADVFERNEDILLSYQEKYHYFLVDEYQDTNNTQNTVVDLLAGYWGENANIFVVGDPSQCIMRFQGASLENIISFRDKYPNAKYIELDINYRSSQPILDAAHKLIPSSTKLIGRKTNNEVISHYEFNSSHEELTYLVQSIQSLISKGIEHKNIAIIYRNNQDAQVLANILSTSGISYHLQKGEDVASSSIIKQLIKIISLLLELRKGEDDTTLFTVMHYDYFQINSLDILKLSRYAATHKQSLWETLTSNESLDNALVVAKEKLTNFRSKILTWQSKDAILPVTLLIDQIFKESGMLDYCLSHKDSLNYLAALNAFFAEITKMSLEDHTLNLEGLIENLSLMKREGIGINREYESDQNSITLTTAHSAKGLEWDYVFIYKTIDGLWGNNKSRSLIPLPEKIIKHQSLKEKDKNEDERRLFYVALTRAKIQCVITSSMSYAIDTAGKDKLPSLFIEEIGKDLLPTTKLHIETSYFISDLQSSVINNQDNDFLKELLENIKLSPTSLNTYLDCPYKFKIKNLLQVPSSSSPQLCFGRAIHRALESIYKKILVDEPINLNDLLEVFNNSLSQEIMSKTDFSNYLNKGKEVLTYYYQNYAKDEFIKPLFIEKYFGYGASKILLHNIELVGKIDRIDLINHQGNHVRIVDYKTGKYKTKGQIIGTTKTSSGNYYRQLVFYRLLAELDKSFPYIVDEVRLDFIEPDEKGNFRRYDFKISEEDVESLKSTIIKTIQEIRALNFSRTKLLKTCESCELIDHCYPNGMPR